MEHEQVVYVRGWDTGFPYIDHLCELAYWMRRGRQGAGWLYFNVNRPLLLIECRLAQLPFNTN